MFMLLFFLSPPLVSCHLWIHEYFFVIERTLDSVEVDPRVYAVNSGRASLRLRFSICERLAQLVKGSRQRSQTYRYCGTSHSYCHTRHDQHSLAESIY